MSDCDEDYSLAVTPHSIWDTQLLSGYQDKRHIFWLNVFIKMIKYGLIYGAICLFHRHFNIKYMY